MTPIWSYSSHNLWVGGTINTQDKFLKAFILQCITDFTGRSCMRMLYRVTFCTTQFMVSRFRASLTPLWTIPMDSNCSFCNTWLGSSAFNDLSTGDSGKTDKHESHEIKTMWMLRELCLHHKMKIISKHEQVKSDKNNGSWILVIARNRIIRHWTIIQCLENQDYKMSLCLCQEPRRNFFLLYTVSSDDKVYH